jgi:hypothetical protein
MHDHIRKQLDLVFVKFAVIGQVEDPVYADQPCRNIGSLLFDPVFFSDRTQRSASERIANFDRRNLLPHWQ